MLVDAKTGCLYPNNSRALFEAKARGFDNAVVRTPTVNGTFLSGITRRQVTGLLCKDGVSVVEETLTYRDFQTADEIFTRGNSSKAVPVMRFEDRALLSRPFYTQARRLYWESAGT